MTAFPKPTPTVKEPKPLKARPHRIPDRIREAVYARDGWMCQWCLGPGGRLDLHHKLRRSQGGKDEAANLVSVHRQCHRTIHEHPEIARHRGFLVATGSNDEPSPRPRQAMSGAELVAWLRVHPDSEDEE